MALIHPHSNAKIKFKTHRPTRGKQSLFTEIQLKRPWRTFFDTRLPIHYYHRTAMVSFRPFSRFHIFVTFSVWHSRLGRIFTSQSIVIYRDRNHLNAMNPNWIYDKYLAILPPYWYTTMSIRHVCVGVCQLHLTYAAADRLRMKLADSFCLRLARKSQYSVTIWGLCGSFAEE